MSTGLSLAADDTMVPPPMHADDRALVDGCLRDAPGAWDRFVDRVRGSVTAAIRAVLGGEADVEDCVAEVWALCLARDRALLRSYRGTAQVTTWLHVVARRTALAWRTRAERAPRSGPLPEAADPAPGPGDLAARLDASAQLRAALAELGERDREVLRLFYIEGRSGAEIGDALGIPANQVSVVLHRARDRARKLL